MNDIVLFEDKKDCCGCASCMNICPKEAITMEEDEYGFIYPIIDRNRCVKCGSCISACGYKKNHQKYATKAVFAVANNDENSLKKSASGGAFAVFAKYIIENNGVVYGCSMENIDNKLTPMHIRIDRKEDITKLQGSKYVQSDIGISYKNVKKDLLDGTEVLFTGTPCQVDGLKQFLKKDYDNLLLVEIICHGVPSKKLFQDFILYYGDKLGKEIKEFYFRDKSKGQGMVTRTFYTDLDGNIKETVKNGQLLSYVSLFSKSYTYRINCYSCPFATEERIADLTLGDFWGFHEEYPSYKGKLSNGKGISCILANTDKGIKMIEKCSDDFTLMSSDFDKVSRHNAQLHSPSKYSKKRTVILDLYKEDGYASIDRFFRTNYKKDIIKYSISDLIPKTAKRRIKQIFGYLTKR